MQKHNDDTIKTSGHIYLSLYSKGLCVRGELETEQRLQHIDPPQLFWLSQPFFSVLLGCSTGGLGAQPQLGHGFHSRVFPPTDLNFLSTGLYNNLTSTYFLRASHFTLNSTRRQSKLSHDIIDRTHLLFTQVHFPFWQLGRGQYATTVVELFNHSWWWIRVFTLLPNLSERNSATGVRTRLLRFRSPAYWHLRYYRHEVSTHWNLW